MLHRTKYRTIVDISSTIRDYYEQVAHALPNEWIIPDLDICDTEWEPIDWLVKPYAIGSTVTDNFLKNGLGAINTSLKAEYSVDNTTLLDFNFQPNETRIHEAQKPVKLMQYLIELTTQTDHVVLDPFMGSGTTAVAAMELGRNFVGFEKDRRSYEKAQDRLECIITDGVLHTQV